MKKAEMKSSFQCVTKATDRSSPLAPGRKARTELGDLGQWTLVSMWVWESHTPSPGVMWIMFNKDQALGFHGWGGDMSANTTMALKNPGLRKVNPLTILFL